MLTRKLNQFVVKTFFFNLEYSGQYFLNTRTTTTRKSLLFTYIKINVKFYFEKIILFHHSYEKKINMHLYSFGQELW